MQSVNECISGAPGLLMAGRGQTTHDLLSELLQESLRLDGGAALFMARVLLPPF